MINEKNLTKERNVFLDYRFGGTPFGLARFFHIFFDDNEIKYIETKMETHKLYRLVSGKAAGGIRFVSREFIIVWLESFLDDPEMPVGVRAYIKYFIGHDRGYKKATDEFDKTRQYEESILAEMFAKRWMETCR